MAFYRPKLILLQVSIEFDRHCESGKASASGSHPNTVSANVVVTLKKKIIFDRRPDPSSESFCQSANCVALDPMTDEKGRGKCPISIWYYIVHFQLLLFASMSKLCFY